jgi:hypothetical protein
MTTTFPSFTTTIARPGTSQAFIPSLMYASRLSVMKEGVWELIDTNDKIQKERSVIYLIDEN